MSGPGDRKVSFTESAASRIAAATLAYERGRRDMPGIKFRQTGDGDGGGSTIRLGQFSGSWYNEPGESGADNVKLVKLYVQNSDATGANDWVPELDGDGEETIAVTINLFSHIPTRSGNDSYMWCAVVPISEVSGEYWAGGYDYIDGQDVPRMKPYTQLWLLLAAEC